MTLSAPSKIKPYRGLAMEGAIASWYAKNTASAMPAFAALAQRLAAAAPPPAEILEIAPGPGYLAIELAKLGCRVTGLDISRSFVRIAAANAERAGAPVSFRQGDAAAQPFADDSFDLVVCRAAFKNFGDPVGALGEMHRVLKPGGSAEIVDLRADAADASIDAEVATMSLGAASAFFTRMTLRGLRKRAYSRNDFARMIAASAFRRGEILQDGIGFTVRLSKG